MGKYLKIIVALMFLGITLATPAHAQNDWAAQQRALKAQQRIEWNALLDQQRNRKASWNARKTTSAERSLANHQMQRERRDMKQRHKDTMQDMKDRQKSLNQIQRSYNR